MGIWFTLIIPTSSQHLQIRTIPFMLEVIVVGAKIFPFPSVPPVLILTRVTLNTCSLFFAMEIMIVYSSAVASYSTSFCFNFKSTHTEWLPPLLFPLIFHCPLARTTAANSAKLVLPMAYAWKGQWLSKLGCHTSSKHEWNLMLLRCWVYLPFQRGRILITWIFVFFQFGRNRLPIFHVCFSADVKQNCLTSKSSFRGCLRNLVLTKGQHTELFDFSRAFDLRGVFPHSCPGAEHWTEAKPV